MPAAVGSTRWLGRPVSKYGAHGFRKSPQPSGIAALSTQTIPQSTRDLELDSGAGLASVANIASRTPWCDGVRCGGEAGSSELGDHGIACHSVESADEDVYDTRPTIVAPVNGHYFGVTTGLSDGSRFLEVMAGHVETPG